jgi:L-ribulose-5-phosphate 4-epimerase
MAYEIKEAKELVIKAGLELVKKGLVARTWGNISARISDKQMVITPSGRAYDTLTPDDIVTVDIDTLEYEGSVKPSSEKGVHAAAYQLHEGADFVIHTHQEYATALSTLGKRFLIEKAFPRCAKIIGPSVPTAEYGLSGSGHLMRNVKACLGQNPESRAILMGNHGTLVVGKTYDEAFEVAEKLEEVSMKIYSRLTAIRPPELDNGYSPNKFCTAYRRGVTAEYNKYKNVFDNRKVNCVLEVKTPYVTRAAELGHAMRAYIDDMAQIGGPYIKCLPIWATPRDIAAALPNEATAAVLIPRFGAVCTGPTEDEAEAMMLVLDKCARAALLEDTKYKPNPVNPLIAVFEHKYYVNKYSKLK